MKKTNIKQTEIDTLGFRFFAQIAKFSVKYRYLVILFWIVALVIIVHNLPNLTSVTQNNNSNFLPASSPTQKALNMEDAFQPSNLETVPVIVATNNNQPISTGEQININNLGASLAKVKDVKKVINRGKSKDLQAEIIAVSVPNYDVNTSPDNFINSLRTDIAGSQAVKDGLVVHLSGQLAAQVDESNGSGKDNRNVQLGTIVFIIILLLLIFRAPLAPLVTLLPPVFVVAISGPIIAEAAKHGLKVSSLAQLLITVLVLGAGTDYGLFLIFRVREEIEGGLSHKDAIVKALSRVGESITFSAATVIAALLSLLLASFQLYSNLGIPLAISIALMLLAGLTLLPALLAVFGRAVFWPTKPQKHQSIQFGLWGRICARVVKRPILVLIIGLIFFGALAAFVPGYKSGGFGGTTSPPSNSDSAKGDALVAKHFPGSSASPTEVLFKFNQPIWQNPSAISQAASLLVSSKQFNHVSGPLSPNGISISDSQFTKLYKILGSPYKLPALQPPSLKIPEFVYETYRSTQAYISQNGQSIQFLVNLSAGGPLSDAAMNATPQLRNTVNRITAQLHASEGAILGTASAYYDISKLSNQDLLRVVPVAAIVIGLLLAFLIKSLIAPLYLVISVVLSYLAALGLSVIIFMDIAGNSGVVFILPFLMFIFLLALGEDYNILVMTRIKEESHGQPLKVAVTQALNTTGTTVTSAGLVLAGTFSVLGVVGGSQEVQDIGFGLAAGILMDTFLVRTLIVPSVVVLLGKWNWWPSKHGSWAKN
jgi:RND superfamily putative drug exporter